MSRFRILRSKRRLLAAATGVLAAVAASPVFAASARASATVFQFMQDASGSFTATNPCNGEIVIVSGTTHLEFVVVTDGVGGAHLEAHYNFQDVTGQGGLGNSYQVPTSVDELAEVYVGTAFTFVYQQRFVSSSSADNFATTMLVHLTVNAEGTVTSSQTLMSATCTG
jgi:hypothetical protein